MNAILNHISTHMEDKFYWPEPSSHGKPLDLLAIESRIDKLEDCYKIACDIEPLPWDLLEELDDEIRQLTKVRDRIWDEWQEKIRNQQKEESIK